MACGLAVPILAHIDAPAPAFLVPEAAFLMFAHIGVSVTARDSGNWALFTRCRELAAFLLPGLTVWSIVWVRVCRDALDLREATRLAAIEAQVHTLDSIFNWVERARLAELIVAGVILLLLLVRGTYAIHAALTRHAKAFFPWLTRVSQLWIGLTAFTLLGPAPAAASLVTKARVELSKRRDDLANERARVV